ncbi:MAG: hypothetical protein JO142_04400 [Burkholderiales bacterium]|nr:hypothetical protein [Burkholderiales bacterium]
MSKSIKVGTVVSGSRAPSLLKVILLLVVVAAVGCWVLIEFLGLSTRMSLALTGGVVFSLIAGFTTRVIQARRRLARAVALEHEVLRHAEAAFNQLRAEEAARAARQTSG